jgi:hypothetical protein
VEEWKDDGLMALCVSGGCAACGALWDSSLLVLELELELVLADSSRLFLRHFLPLAQSPRVRKIEDTPPSTSTSTSTRAEVGEGS